MAYSRQGNRNRAREDLQASVDLLPTAMAANELGTMALDANDRAGAKQYFQMAAAAPGDMGAQAQSAFLRLDVPDNPATYVQSGVYLDQSGRLILQVKTAPPSPWPASPSNSKATSAANSNAASSPSTTSPPPAPATTTPA